MVVVSILITILFINVATSNADAATVAKEINPGGFYLDLFSFIVYYSFSHSYWFTNESIGN